MSASSVDACSATYFAYHIDHVHAEAAGSLVQPEPHEAMYGLTYSLIIPVEVWLRLVKDVQIVLRGCLVICPSTSCTTVTLRS